MSCEQVLKMSKPQLVLRFTRCPGVTLADVTAALNLYPSYADDAEARADGLTTHDLYWFSITTDTGIYDTLKRVSPL